MKHDIEKYYWKPETESEARVIVALLGTKYRAMLEHFNYTSSVNTGSIGVSGNKVWHNLLEEESRTLSTLPELLEMAANGFEPVKWVPKINESYYRPEIYNGSAEAECYYYANDDIDKRHISQDLAFRTEQEAIDCAKFMLDAWKNRDK